MRQGASLPLDTRAPATETVTDATDATDAGSATDGEADAATDSETRQP
jgi:hypothetical protein